MSAEESQKLSETDKMLLGEVDITPASGSTDNNMGEPSDSDNDKLNGTMGTSTLGDKKGNKIKSEEIKETKAASMEPPKVVPQKRGAASTNGADDGSPPTKKRSPAKPKVPTKGSTVAMTDNDGEVAPPVTPKSRATRKKAAAKTASTEEDGDTTTASPVTPSTKSVSPKKGTTAKPTGNTTMDDDEDPITPPTSTNAEKTNVRGTPRKRAAPKDGVAKPRGIPSSYEEADAADRMMVAMKEDQDKTWAEIRVAWKTMTGQDTGASTLPNRYNRIKVNMMRFQDGDDAKLMNAVIDVEDNLEKEKWNLITVAMTKRNAGAYPTIFLQKKYKEFIEAFKTGKGDELLEAMKKEAERFANGDFGDDDGDEEDSGPGEEEGEEMDVKQEGEEVDA